MVTDTKLAVILHCDVVGSTSLVRIDERVAHRRIQHAFRRFSEIIRTYGGTPHELRGDALLATFNRASDAVSASLSFQQENTKHNEAFEDEIRPQIRIGIALGEVVIADGTLTGPGVIMAQRIEQMAEPGGICLHGSVYESVPRRLTFEYRNIGEHQFKGFDELTRVYAVESEPGEIPQPDSQARPGQGLTRRTAVFALIGFLLVASGLIAWLQFGKADFESADLDKMAYALPDKPSIAVLPFDNLSADAEQDYFSDGITEDIITDLSKVSGLFVVARNSTFTYKGQAAKVGQVAEELGVRYVLEGSVRRSGNTIRVTAQLIDALAGNHLWAERYDRELEDIFAVQSEVARQVTKALAVTLKANENERLFQKYTANIDAYEVFLQARRTVDQPSRDNILRGEELFKRVIALDPNFAGGYAGLSFNYSVQVRFQYSNSPESRLAQAFALADKAIELDPGYVWGYIALGGAHLANEDPGKAVEAVRKALSLDPNGYETNLFMGFYLQFAGEAALAIEHLTLARRLSPVVTVRDIAFMRLAQFMNRNYAEVVRLTDEWSHKLPGQGSSGNADVVIAASYALLDKPQQAAAVVKRLLEANPGFNLQQWRYGRLWQSEENRARLYDAAKRAGIPEFPPEQ